MNTSNTELTNPLSVDDLDSYIKRYQEESEYWTLSRKERNKIDAQRYKAGLPKYRPL